MYMLDSMNPSLFSGLVAAIISGVVTLVGYIITAAVQNSNSKKTIYVQREIAQMQKDEKLFYESQLDWANEVRKLIASFVSNCFKLNVFVKRINKLEESIKKAKTPEEKSTLSKEDARYVQKSADIIMDLNEKVTTIRLYLFRKDNEKEKKVLDMILLIEGNMDAEKGISSKLLDSFVNVARDYFDNQMKELKEKSA